MTLDSLKYQRILDERLKKHFSHYREVLILLGPRQAGKTTLLQRVFPEAQYYLVDNEPVRKLLESYDVKTYSTFIRPNSSVIIDESHLLNNPGRMAKIIHDQIPGVKLILTGSSSFHLKKGTQESLAGRKIDYNLFPLTLEEYLFQTGIEPEIQFNLFHNLFSNEKETIPKLYDLKAILENLLIYGLFPNSINHPQDRLYLKNFVDSIIYKDLLGTGLIENQRVASDLLKLLAYQIGNLVNYSELATKLGVDQRTIKRYIQIFEDSFLIVRIPPFIPNPRDAVVKSDKIYFLDLGIRNALLEDYNDIRLRPDAGALFENFIIIEVLKANLYMNANYHLHFWRSRQGSEVDLILTKGKEIYAVEIKMSKQKKNRAFMNKFPEAKFTSITMENLL